MIRNDYMKMVRSTGGARFAELAALGETVFHAGDLGNLWGIKKQRTLYETLSRYCRKGLLYRIHKGMYSLKNPSAIQPFLLGVKALHRYAYISCETILFDIGMINQPSREITIISSISKRYSVAGHRFRSRKLADKFLFNDYGIELRDGVRIASSARAIADMLYFYPRKHFDAPIDWPEVKKIMASIGYTLHPDSYDDSSPAN